MLHQLLLRVQLGQLEEPAMPLRDLVIYPDPLLRETCEPVGEIDPARDGVLLGQRVLEAEIRTEFEAMRGGPPQVE